MPVKLVVHEFRLGDVEDPDLYAAEPIYKWQQTEAGRFVMEHAIDAPYFVQLVDSLFFYNYKIIAEMTESDAVFYQLKYIQ
jgi:hypothetical protein